MRLGSSADRDPVLSALNDVIRAPRVNGVIRDALERVLQKLGASSETMAWEIIPFEMIDTELPENIRSCWVFAIRAGAETGAERHPNSHQRSCSLVGSGRFELRAGGGWRSHPLRSADDGSSMEQRWVSIPPSTWHRLFVGSEAWAMVSFHTVPPEELIEERPMDANDLDGETHQARYAERR
ncbi:MAG TPA: hypothetical protein VK886_01150 [Vicinamibacterales bacterium]|nr:hypothetical protein [Vicinamibacterales bacterium]